MYFVYCVYSLSLLLVVVVVVEEDLVVSLNVFTTDR